MTQNVTKTMDIDWLQIFGMVAAIVMFCCLRSEKYDFEWAWEDTHSDAV